VFYSIFIKESSMSINLEKKTGINLTKGSKITLEKNGKRLEHVCIGLNWGAITQHKETSFLGMFKQERTRSVGVDLDGSASLFASTGEYIETVYYQQLRSNDGAITHSGDDLVGDRNGDDDLDNEVLQVDLPLISPRVTSIFLYLNSYKGQDFSTIPYAKIRLFEGVPDRVDSVIATYNIAAEERFKGYVSMVLAKLVRQADGGWECVTIGDPVPTRNIQETIYHIQQHYLK
jgi:tellurium resistance protein TerZ